MGTKRTWNHSLLKPVPTIIVHQRTLWLVLQIKHVGTMAYLGGIPLTAQDLVVGALYEACGQNGLPWRDSFDVKFHKFQLDPLIGQAEEAVPA